MILRLLKTARRSGILTSSVLLHVALTPGIDNKETLLVDVLFKECFYYLLPKEIFARGSLEIKCTGEPHHAVISESEGWSS